jgi:hypothetical protein
MDQGVSNPARGGRGDMTLKVSRTRGIQRWCPYSLRKQEQLQLAQANLRDSGQNAPDM